MLPRLSEVPQTKKLFRDFIGRFGKLTEDFQEVCGHLQTNHITLPHQINGAGDDYREYYDED